MFWLLSYWHDKHMPKQGCLVGFGGYNGRYSSELHVLKPSGAEGEEALEEEQPKPEAAPAHVSDQVGGLLALG